MAIMSVRNNLEAWSVARSRMPVEESPDWKEFLMRLTAVQIAASLLL
jgi:hypothetical protein